MGQHVSHFCFCTILCVMGGIASADVSISGNVTFEYNDDSGVSGADSITGQVNGFLNIAPSMGPVANFFSANTLDSFSGLVLAGEFTTLDAMQAEYGELSASPGLAILENFSSNQMLLTGFSGSATNLTNLTTTTDTSNWLTDNPSNLFEYMPLATFATFDSFVGATTEVEPFNFRNLISPNLPASLPTEMIWTGNNGEELTLLKATQTSQVNGSEVTNTTLSLVGSVSGESYGGSASVSSGENRAPTLEITENTGIVNILYGENDESIYGMSDTGTFLVQSSPYLTYLHSFFDNQNLTFNEDGKRLKIVGTDSLGSTVAVVAFDDEQDLFNSLEPRYSGYILGADGEKTLIPNYLVTNENCGSYGGYTSDHASNALTSGLPAGLCEIKSVGIVPVAISGDGKTVIGQMPIIDKYLLAIGDLANALQMGSFTWTEEEGISRSDIFTNAVNYDGSVIVGSVEENTTTLAARWTESQGVTTLGDLAGGRDYSVAFDVSDDGSYITGISDVGTTDDIVLYEGFIWSQSEGMRGIGRPSGASQNISSVPHSISGDGQVVVGFTADLNEADVQTKAFRWSEANGIQGIEEWLVDSGVSVPDDYTFNIATTVNYDGSIVAGSGDSKAWIAIEGKSLTLLNEESYQVTLAASANGQFSIGVDRDATNPTEVKNESFIATASGDKKSLRSWLDESGIDVPSDFDFGTAVAINDAGTVVELVKDNKSYVAVSGKGVVEPESFNQTLDASSDSSKGDLFLSNLTLEGAHHIPLKLLNLKNNQCFWLNGDWLDKASSNTNLQEVGGCMDIDQSTRLGVGIGKSHTRQNIVNTQNSSMSGNYLYGELGSDALNKNVVITTSIFLGEWDTSIERYYQNLGVSDWSTGRPDIGIKTLKLRSDFIDLFQLGDFAVTPSVSLSRTKLDIDAFTETGGGFPAQFDKQTKYMTEFRAGVAAEKRFDKNGKLRVLLDRYEETSRSNSNVTGQVIDWVEFDINDSSSQESRTRLGLELDTKMSNDLTVSTLFSSSYSDGDWDRSAAISFKFGIN